MLVVTPPSTPASYLGWGLLELVPLPELLAGAGLVVELGQQAFAAGCSQGLLDEPAGVLALRAGEAIGLHADAALWVHGDLDGPGVVGSAH